VDLYTCRIDWCRPTDGTCQQSSTKCTCSTGQKCLSDSDC
jgi:hypothetical protein